MFDLAVIYLYMYSGKFCEVPFRPIIICLLFKRFEIFSSHDGIMEGMVCIFASSVYFMVSYILFYAEFINGPLCNKHSIVVFIRDQVQTVPSIKF